MTRCGPVLRGAGATSAPGQRPRCRFDLAGGVVAFDLAERHPRSQWYPLHCVAARLKDRLSAPQAPAATAHSAAVLETAARAADSLIHGNKYGKPHKQRASGPLPTLMTTHKGGPINGATRP